MEVLPRPAGTSKKQNPEASPATDDGAVVEGATPTDTTTKINVMASSTTDGGGVDVTRSTKYIRAPGPPPGDGAMEALPRSVGKNAKINAADDDKSSKSTAEGPSNAAGPSPAVGIKNFTTTNPPADSVAKLAVPVAKNTIRPDNIGETTGQVSVARPEKKEI
jgi:hypothetical protein